MKQSNKILIGLFSLLLVLTFITLFKIKSLHDVYKNSETFGNKNWITSELDLKEFSELTAGEHLKVTWHRGIPHAKIQIEESLKNYLKVQQEGTRVIVKMDSLVNYRINGTIEVDLYSQNLDKITLIDFVSFETLDTLSGNELLLELSDHSNASVFLKAAKFELSQFNFSQLTLIGSAQFAKMKLSDHCQLDAQKISIDELEMDMDDFSQAELNVNSKLQAVCSDHSQLEYQGDSVTAEIKQRDFSQVNKK
jgi:hypothetical protein